MGLDVARGATPAGVDAADAAQLLAHYRTPLPRLDCAAMIASVAHAAMDVSDGLLADAPKIARASGVAIEIDLESVPAPAGAAQWFAPAPIDRLFLAAGGDDYEILFTAPPSARAAIAGRAHRIGRVTQGAGLTLAGGDGRALTPQARGYVHRLGQGR
jgi:thiamine-monophosphate kinase